MKIKYFQDTDTLYIEFRGTAIAESRDLDENTLLELDAVGNVCAITMEHAKERADFPAFSFEQIQFETGESCKFDVEPRLDFPVYQRLRKVDYFSSARVENGTVVWDEQCHLSPDSIYLQGEPV